MHSAHRILNAVWFHSIRNQRHQEVCALAEKNDWRIQINSEKLFQIICAKQTRTKGKGLKKNRMVQSETGSDQNGSKVEKYLKATDKKLKGNTNHLVELKTTPRPNRGVSPLVVRGTPDQGEKFQGSKWMTPPESGRKKMHKKKSDSDKDDLVQRFGMVRSTDCAACVNNNYC